MNANNHPSNSDPDHANLHLDKFVAKPSSAPAGGAASDENLTSFIVKAAAETCQEKKVVLPNNAGPLPAESMLGIVSYCYVKGVYSSNDIGREMCADPALRASCHDEMPRPEDIRRFRRLNREAIQATLEKFFRGTRKTISHLWWPDNPFRNTATTTPAQTPAPEPAPFIPAPRAEETQVFVRREANDRLDKASFIDGMSM